MALQKLVVKKVQKYKNIFISFASIFLVSIFFIVHIPYSHVLFEIASHFKFQLILFYIVVGIFSFWKKKNIMGAFSFIAVLFFVVEVVPLFVSPRNSLDGEQVKIMEVNVLTTNTHKKELNELIRKENPDIMAILEVSQSWVSSLDEFAVDYPYSIALPRDDNFGIALYSKYPLSNIDTLYFETKDGPSLVGDLYINGRTVHVIVTHVLPPFNSDSFQKRTNHLKNMASYIQSLSSSVILVGDMNASEASYSLNLISKNIGLKSARNGFGYLPTWPATFPIKIPIDHILVSDDIGVEKTYLGEEFASDHLPLITILEI